MGSDSVELGDLCARPMAACSRSINARAVLESREIAVVTYICRNLRRQSFLIEEPYYEPVEGISKLDIVYVASMGNVRVVNDFQFTGQELDL